MSGVYSSVRTCSAGGEYVDSSIFALPLSLLSLPSPFTNRERDVAPFFLQWTESCSKLLNVSTPFFRVTGCYTPLLNGSQVKKTRGALNLFLPKRKPILVSA